MRMKVSLKAVLISVCVSWALSVQALAQNDVYKINIPAQSLASALISLSEQTNVSVLVANDLVSGKQVESINDSLEVGEVLDILLAGTDLVYEFNDSTIVISQNTSTSEPVSTGSDSEASVSEEVIDEVVVTTQFREQSLQDVPLSISAFSGELIDDAGMSTITDVAKFTPGFTASQFSSSEPILAIRGANNTFSSAAANKPVGVFLDDVYVSRNSGAVFDLFDVEQVTVLRGPQGTLLGRNLTGGAIHIKTVKPSLDETNAKFQLLTRQ